MSPIEPSSEEINKNTKNLMEKFGDEVRAKRAQHNITQEKLAFMCNTDTAYINRLEKGKCNNITLKTIIKIALILGIILSKIF